VVKGEDEIYQNFERMSFSLFAVVTMHSNRFTHVGYCRLATRTESEKRREVEILQEFRMKFVSIDAHKNSSNVTIES
jgi:hypothetical protein